MTDINHTPSALFSELSVLDEHIADASDLLDRLERAGRPFDKRYVEIENRWDALVAERDAIEKRLLALPISDLAEVRHRAGIIARITENDPHRGADLWQRLGAQVKRWATVVDIAEAA